jgi:DNA segregation ATPase FtsK/SpoIIIE-like protein
MWAYVAVSITCGLLAAMVRAAQAQRRQNEQQARATQRQPAPSRATRGNRHSPGSNGDDPDLLSRAAELIIMTQSGSVPLLQRHLGVNHAKAAALMDVLQANGIVGPPTPGPCKVLISPSDREQALRQLRRGHPLTRVRR